MRCQLQKNRFNLCCTDGMNLIAAIRQEYDNYDFENQILSASVSNTIHDVNYDKLESAVVTTFLSFINGLLRPPLTYSGLAQFLADYIKRN